MDYRKLIIVPTVWILLFGSSIYLEWKAILYLVNHLPDWMLP